ncbi:MAG: phosphonate metabolism protein/1,5-bisphosphokinase (PRPP-forming) PhnN [Rhodoferax sp.]|uniref:phosphonate metabolism protein/1,5-bisphosphokinase (PRPP-forming) PhnN n=1 Tax=Rhodoferax sp. TaxID=50421 RepID=UPI002726AC03|nr:phosphonate metabolism protein/1,5-bisphosphokinase (PRPP-forming) PhnN [Rhodoferax sp.]MDO8451176.1 phosphonate metabolism protein/1,5-bisphosphokinase (PRPP-forming) PhnN [Rhodoferax sp.]
MSGLWVFVCGPSGAGKDSVLGWAAKRLAARPDIVFARRMVTRASQPGSDHDAVTPQQFARLIGSGGLVWCWEAHGFHYGIEARYAAQVAAGKTVVVNGSRAHVGGLEAAAQVRVVQIVADAAQLATRLEQRGREASHEVSRRLARNALFSDLRADHTILNQGELADAGRHLADYLAGGVGSSTAR